MLQRRLVIAAVLFLMSLIVPFLFYEEDRGFWASIGIKIPRARGLNLGLVLILALYFFLASLDFFQVFQLENPNYIRARLGQLYQEDIYSLVLLVGAGEVFFRGFILKELDKIFPWNLGNFLMSLVFALALSLFIAASDRLNLILMFLYFFLRIYPLGQVNEKYFQGSIFPSLVMSFLASLLFMVFN